MKITRATLKSFIRTNANGLYINQTSNFDGRVDCVMPTNGGWSKINKEKINLEDKYTLGVRGLWLVGSGRDYITVYADDNFIGYEVYNSCGSSLVAFPVQRPN